MNPPVKVMVVERKQDIRHWLGRLLNQTEGFILAGYCSRLDEVEATAARCKPQLILMDTQIATAINPEALTLLRNRLPGVYVVLMGLEDAPKFEVLAQHAGANGFLSKSNVPESLEKIRMQLLPALAGAKREKSP